MVGVGACRNTGVQVCEAGQVLCGVVAGVPVVEVPGNGIDDNCDGRTDELACPGDTVAASDGTACLWLAPYDSNWENVRWACDNRTVLNRVGRHADLETLAQIEAGRALQVGRDTDLWIGASRNAGSPSGWRWRNGNNMAARGPLAPWSDGEPNDASPGESCAAMRDVGFYNDLGCWRARRGLCMVSSY
jgi:hypothetical protein